MTREAHHPPGHAFLRLPAVLRSRIDTHGCEPGRIGLCDSLERRTNRHALDDVIGRTPGQIGLRSIHENQTPGPPVAPKAPVEDDPDADHASDDQDSRQADESPEGVDDDSENRRPDVDAVGLPPLIDQMNDLLHEEKGPETKQQRPASSGCSYLGITAATHDVLLPRAASE